nr:hypothetical protein CcurKRNrm1_p056 [Cryptomonas curvata]
MPRKFGKYKKMKFIFKNFLKNDNRKVLYKNNYKKYFIITLFKKENLKIQNIITVNLIYYLINISKFKIKCFKISLKPYYHIQKIYFRKNDNLYSSIRNYLLNINPLNKLYSSFSIKLCVLFFLFLKNKNLILNLKKKILPLKYFRNFFLRFRIKFLLFL